MKHYLSCLVFLSVFLLGPGCGGGDITLNGAELGEEIFGVEQTGNGRGRENAKQETIWFSPHCLSARQASLF